MWYGGIDPGLEGAIAFIYDNRGIADIEIYDIPITTMELSKRKQMRVDGNEIWGLLKSWKARRPVIGLEHLWGMGAGINIGGERGQFTFADDYGLIRGLLIASGLKFLMVPPQTWQAFTGKPKGSDKSGSIKRAIELYPKHSQLLIRPGARTYSDGRADALLIAHYCKMAEA